MSYVEVLRAVVVANKEAQTLRAENERLREELSHAEEERDELKHWDTEAHEHLDTLGIPREDSSGDELTVKGRIIRRQFKCGARPWVKSDPPQDCDWPLCGCDAHADRVVGALEEAGLLRPVANWKKMP